MSVQTDSHRAETHEQFVQRASRFFPPERVHTWSRVERAVFNSLMGKLIHRHGYESITDAMLYGSREDMAEIVGHCVHARTRCSTAE